MKMNLRGRCDGVDVTASLRAGDDPGAARLHDALPDRRRDGRRARVARLQARPVVHAREDPRVLDSHDPDVRRHRGDHPLDLPAGRLRVVPVVLSPSCRLPVVVPLPLPMSRLIKSFVNSARPVLPLSIPYLRYRYERYRTFESKQRRNSPYLRAARLVAEARRR